MLTRRAIKAIQACFLALLVAWVAFGSWYSSPYFPPNTQTVNGSYYGTDNSSASGASPKADDRIAEYTWWVAAFTCVLAVVSSFQIFFLIRANRTAQIAAEHIPRVERGYIVGGGPSPVGNGFACIDIANYGKTVAILTKVEWGFCEETDFPTDAPVSELLKTGRLKVDGCLVVEDVFPANRPPGYLQETRFPISQALGKIFYGKFTYSILFDSDEHFSTFKLRVRPTTPGPYISVGLPGSNSDWK